MGNYCDKSMGKEGDMPLQNNMDNRPNFGTEELARMEKESKMLKDNDPFTTDREDNTQAVQIDIEH